MRKGLNFSKHLGEPHIIKIDGEEIELEQISIKYMPQFMKVLKTMGGLKDDSSSEELFSKFDESTTEAIKDLIMATLEASFEDFEKNKEKYEQFAMKHMLTLFMEIITMNTPEDNNMETIKKKDIIAKIKERQSDTKSNTQ